MRVWGQIPGQLERALFFRRAGAFYCARFMQRALRFIMRRGVNSGGSVNFDAELMLVAALALAQR